jgi:hypothetical protein
MENFVIYIGWWYLRGYDGLGMRLEWERCGMHIEFWWANLLENISLEDIGNKRTTFLGTYILRIGSGWN